MVIRHLMAAAGAALLLAGCATAPRVPAASLADAGIKTTGTVSAQVEEMAEQLRSAPKLAALNLTLEQCSAPGRTCKPVLEEEKVTASRNKLADVVALRAKALKALGTAYAALQTEAGYDQPADLSGAASDAIKSAEAFAASAAALAGSARPAPTLPETVGSLADFGFRAIGEQLQRKRILKSSRDIAQATLKIRNGMIAESAAFHRISEDIAFARTSARLSLMDAGLVSRNDVLQQLADDLKVKLVPDFATRVASSNADQTALRAVTQAIADREVAAAGNRYDQAIAALGALLTSHAQLEAGQPMSLGDVERFLAALNASLDKDKPAPDGQTP